MTITYTAPVDRRSMATAAAIGGCVGLAIGSAYVAGALARSSVEDARARLVAGSPASVGAAPVLGRLQTAPPAVAALAPPSLARAGLRGPAAPARDLECLSQAVYYEARGEEERGRQAVAQVVMNRSRQTRFPRTICGVVFQHAASGCAFSFACDGQTRHALEPGAWRDARRIAQRTLAGFTLPELRTATDFRSGGGSPAGLERVAQIGAHVFYRWTGRLAHASAPAAPKPAASPPTPPVAVEAPTPAPVLVKADATVKADASAKPAA